MELNNIVLLLQRVFPNREQADRLNRFLKQRYGSQFHPIYSPINSPTVNYLVRKEEFNFF
jgi:hypothetical protein